MSSSPRFIALQYRDFRLLWFGRLVSAVGSQTQIYAINWHVAELLGEQVRVVELLGREWQLQADALGLGFLGLVRVGPIIIFALLGGIVADNVDRRRILIWTQLASLFFSLVLAVLTLWGQITVGWIYVLSAFAVAAVAFDEPARQSLVPNLVPPKHLAKAVSLNSLLFYVSAVSGPATAGILIRLVGVGAAYLLDSITFVAVLVALALMHYRRPPEQKGGGYDVAALIEGLRFTFRSRLIWSTMLLDFFATFFSSARTMLPLIARDILGLGSLGYGLLGTAQPVGAILAGLVVAARRRDIYRQGAVLLVSVAVYGLATALFGLSTVIAVSYVLFALTGAGDMVSTVIRGTIRQLVTPDHLRGRMNSVNMIFFMGGPQLGELEAGLVAAVFSVPVAIFTGGLATVFLTGWIAWRYPSLRNFTRDSYRQIAEEGGEMR